MHARRRAQAARRSTCASSPRPTAISRPRSAARRVSARISTSASTASRLLVPPLRERRGRDRAAGRSSSSRRRARQLGRPRAAPRRRGARRGCARYRWPGNMRELRNVIERAVLLSTGATIDAGASPRREDGAGAARRARARRRLARRGVGRSAAHHRRAGGARRQSDAGGARARHLAHDAGDASRSLSAAAPAQTAREPRVIRVLLALAAPLVGGVGRSARRRAGAGARALRSRTRALHARPFRGGAARVRRRLSTVAAGGVPARRRALSPAPRPRGAGAHHVSAVSRRGAARRCAHSRGAPLARGAAVRRDDAADPGAAGGFADARAAHGGGDGAASSAPIVLAPSLVDRAGRPASVLGGRGGGHLLRDSSRPSVNCASVGLGCVDARGR